jgi:hypothetical protein
LFGIAATGFKTIKSKKRAQTLKLLFIVFKILIFNPIGAQPSRVHAQGYVRYAV